MEAVRTIAWKCLSTRTIKWCLFFRRDNASSILHCLPSLTVEQLRLTADEWVNESGTFHAHVTYSWHTWQLSDAPLHASRNSVTYLCIPLPPSDTYVHLLHLLTYLCSPRSWERCNDTQKHDRRRSGTAPLRYFCPRPLPPSCACPLWKSRCQSRPRSHFRRVSPSGKDR